MAGFIRRYKNMQSLAVLTAIEGVVIIDESPPQGIEGVGVGRVAVVGEFADMTYGVSVDSSGVVSTKPQPVQIFGGQDLIDKVGGFDETIGQFGGAMGNGFVTMRNKKYQSLVAVPINLASSRGIRVWRELPTNKSATDPTPTVPLLPAQVVAGREFKSAANRVRVAARVNFTDDGPLVTGVDGTATPAGLPAATQTFDSPGSNFTTAGVEEGDIVQVGVIGAAGAQGTDAGTYRVVSVASAVQLVIERMDGTNFTVGNWVASAALAFRVHPGATADSSPTPHQLSEAGGYQVPARPLDATIAVATLLTPTVVPPAGTATAWDPLSGLTARTMPGATGLVYDANVQAANAANHASIDTLYGTAIDSLLADADPSHDVAIVNASRKSSSIRAKLKAHDLQGSAQGRGRRSPVSPELSNVTFSTILGSADPGVGANRDERIDYSWPGGRMLVPEAVGFSIAGADGSTVTDGVLDVPMDDFLASVESNIQPFRNPGELTPETQAVLGFVSGFQRGNLPTLDMAAYIQMRQSGICALRFVRTANGMAPIFQSGVTTSLVQGEKNIARRRMADFIQDSGAERFVLLAKQPMTTVWKDSLTAQAVDFLEDLLSKNNPPQQQIDGYEVDDTSGNTDDLEAAGVFVLIARVRLLATGDVIVWRVQASESVILSQAA